MLVPRLMIESRGVNYGSVNGVKLTLPVTGSEIAVERDPIVNEFDIPVRYIGVGEGIEDLRPYDAKQFTDSLFS